MRSTVGIIGNGFVGKAVAQLSEVYDVEIYDPYQVEHQFNLGAFEQDFVFVCVPTPSGPDGQLDTSIVEETARKWNKVRSPDSVLIIKSTIPVGTTDRLCEELDTDRIVHNPEFLTQRTAMEDFRYPTEVIIGGRQSMLVRNLYEGYYPMDRDFPYYNVSPREAELIKMVRNSYYATKVTFFNQVYELCEKLGISYRDFRDVFTLEGNHPWLASQHTQVPGPDGKFGFGGACLPKDSEGLVRLAEKHDVDMLLLRDAISYNNRRRK